MSRLTHNTLLSFCFVIFLSSFCYGQNSTFAFDSHPLFSDSLDIINGEEWTYIKSNVGHPFLYSQDWRNADIVYNGVSYRNVAAKYNCELEELIVFVKKGDEALTYKLNKQRLNSFCLRVENIKGKVCFKNEKLLKQGDKALYAKLYEGNSSYFVRYRKYVNKVVSAGYTGEYLMRSGMYLKQADNLYELHSKAHLLEILNDKKATLKKFMRKNHIKFDRKHPEQLIPVFQYYDSLN